MTFKEEKGKVIARVGGGNVRIVVHEKTDSRLVDWLDEAIHKAGIERQGGQR